MFIVNLKRVIKFGVQGIFRNKGLSLQVIFIMAFAVFTFTSLFIFKDLSAFLISEAEKKVDVSIYFKKGISEQDILEVKDKLYKFSESIKQINYISEEQAKEEFISRHEDDPLYITALDEVGGNPFLASLNVKADDSAFYAQISSFLSKPPLNNLVEDISYYQNKDIINQLFSITSKISRTGIFLSLFLMVLVFFIILNTIKLTILARSDEIATMRLVGASNWFIRGPFLIQILLYGLISIVVVDILFFIVFSLWSKGLQNWFFGFNLLKYFVNNFFLLLASQIVAIFVLGGLSSVIAIRKYLKI